MHLRVFRSLRSLWKTFRKAWVYGLAIDGNCHLKHGLRWGFLAIIRPCFSEEWFNWIERSDLQPFVKANPMLALRPLRPYLSIRWNRKKRFKVIGDTYDFVLCQGGAMRRALLHPDGISLARLDIAELGRIEIRLGKDIGFRREGEFVLSMQCRELSGWRMVLAFAMEKAENMQWTCYIGCVQGRGGIEAMRRTTKAFHGLRPKTLIVFVAQEVAGFIGARKILGAGDAIHVYRRKHLIHLPFRHNISFDYDSFWSEFGAGVDAEGWFHLPLQMIRRDYNDIKSNKRSMYARRYAMLDGLSEQLRISMTQSAILNAGCRPINPHYTVKLPRMEKTVVERQSSRLKADEIQISNHY